MILHNGDILADGFLDAVRKLLKVPMPVKTSFKLAKSVKAISEQYDAALEQRTELIKRHGKDNGKGGFDVRLSSPEEQKVFFEQLNELNDIEFEIPLEGKIDPEKINFTDDVQMSTAEFLALASILKIDDDVVAETPATEVPPAPAA